MIIIPLRLGQQFLNFIEEKARAIALGHYVAFGLHKKLIEPSDSIEKNEFKTVGALNYPCQWQRIYENDCTIKGCYTHGKNIQNPN